MLRDFKGFQKSWDVLVFLKFGRFSCELKEPGSLGAQKVKFEQAISMLKQEKLPNTNSTKSGAH